MKRSAVPATVRALAAPVVLVVSGVAMAQPALEEVIVTAQKTEQNLQKTPISLSVLDSGTIERLGITNAADIATLVPNLAMRPFGASPTTLRFFIRGVGGVDSQLTQDSPVGIYLDGVYLARNMGLAADVADIERIEVLRGPQGALYGRNTTGGAVNIVTRRPSDTTEFSQLLSMGRFEHFRSRTMLNVPLSDTVAARVAYQHNQRDGWIENTGVGPDFHEYDRDAARIDLRWRASDSITVDYAFDRSQSDYTSVYWHLDEPNARYTGVLSPQTDRVDEAELPNPVEDSEDRSSGHALTVSIDTPIGELKSITAYREMEQDAYNEYSGNPDISFFRNNRLGVEQDQWSQELQLVGSTASEQLDYVAGLYYFTEDGREISRDQIPVFGINSPRDIAVDNESWAAYSKLTWRAEASSAWAYSIGARYTQDKREGTRRGVTVQEGSENFDNFSPSFTVTYQLNDDVGFYGSVTSGYKSGGFNMRQTAFTENYDEEELLSWELGWRSELLARRLRFNGAVFYMDYTDIQLDILVPNQPNPTLTQTQNAGEAEVIGIETDITVALTENVRFALSYAWLDNDIKEVEGDDADLWQLPNAIENSLNATLDADLMQTSGGTLNLAIDYAWRDDSPAPARKAPGFDIDAYGLVNARLSLTGDDWLAKGGYRVSVWGRNLLDEEYYIDSLGSFAGLFANRLASYGDPRTWGVDLEYRF